MIRAVIFDMFETLVTVTVTKDSGALIADYLVNEYKDYQWKQLSKYR